MAIACTCIHATMVTYLTCIYMYCYLCLLGCVVIDVCSEFISEVSLSYHRQCPASLNKVAKACHVAYSTAREFRGLRGTYE